jgi:hypothetical protein
MTQSRLSTDEKTRIAQTEALFREVNERIAETAAPIEPGDGSFVCECADSGCTHRIDATVAEYEAVRAEPTRFLLAPGHSDERVERVIRRRPGYEVVEKVETTVRAMVRRLDPRAEPA